MFVTTKEHYTGESRTSSNFAGKDNQAKKAKNYEYQMQKGKEIRYTFCVPTRKDKVKLLETKSVFVFGLEDVDYTLPQRPIVVTR